MFPSSDWFVVTTLTVGFAFLIGGSPTAQADLIITARYSEVSYNTVNLTDGIPPSPPSTQTISTTSLTAPFQATLFESFNHFTVTGAFNTGNINVFQNSTVSPTGLFADTSQSGFVMTDFNGPAIYTRSLFALDFEVAAPLEIVLTGLIEGSSIVGNSDFARVLLTANSGPIFDTGFGHTFPFNDTLLPGVLYYLRVESSGAAFAAPPFTPNFVDTSSRAQAQFTVVPELGFLGFGLLILGLLVLGRSWHKRER